MKAVQCGVHTIRLVAEPASMCCSCEGRTKSPIIPGQPRRFASHFQENGTDVTGVRERENTACTDSMQCICHWQLKHAVLSSRMSSSDEPAR